LGHVARNCYHHFDIRYTTTDTQSVISSETKALVVEPNLPIPSTTWFLDSGASTNVTSDINNLSSSYFYTGPEAVHIGNDTGLQIAHKGNVILLADGLSLILNNVLHVPSITKNLLGVSQLLKDNSVSIESLSDYCLIKDVKSNKTLLYGRLHNGLYQLNSLSSYQTHALHTSTASADIGHFQPGKCSTSIIEGLRKDQLISVNSLKFPVCLDCNKTKAHKLPFVNSTSCASRPLEVIHSDFWGPVPIVPQKGNMYYVLFIDEFSRFTWLYPFSCKSSVQFFLLFSRIKSKLYLLHQLLAFSVMVVGNISLLCSNSQISLLECHVLTLLSRMAWPNVSIDMLLNWLWQPFPMPQSL
jgi:hypothetical protein